MAKDWREEYQSKFISAEEAAQKVKSGDQVVFTAGREAYAAGLAIASRLGELEGVNVLIPSPGYDFGWYDPGWEISFDVTIMMPTGISQQAVDERRIDINTGTLVPFQMREELLHPDVLLTEVSEPDEKGFCSFGQSVWNKPSYVKSAKMVIAEVNKTLIRTYGDNYVHVSNIDWFVEHVSSGAGIGTGTLAGREKKEPEPFLKDIAGYANSLIKDGDTIQIGVGRSTEPLVGLGLFNNKQDLGWHSEATPQGVISLVREGVINGKYKTIFPGKAVVTSLGGGTRDEMEWATNNPLFLLMDVTWLEDLKVIGALDNFVAINNALAVDITGQIVAESIGTRIMSVAGGQIPFVFGAAMSTGGRSITILPSTASGGTVSRIRPVLEVGSVVTIPRNCAGYVVTEYGIADLWGKSIRQRVESLISVAHPDFREELWSEARKLYWP
ncbi:acetyl-CoA hydrolase/transferase family protein [Chloroflexota bacterium]